MANEAGKLQLTKLIGRNRCDAAILDPKTLDFARELCGGAFDIDSDARRLAKNKVSKEMRPEVPDDRRGLARKFGLIGCAA
jgi:hypothetical protein